MSQPEQTRLDEILSCRGRVRILMLLSNVMELNISEIARRVGLNYTTANRHLIELENAGLVQQKRFGRIRIYKFSDANSKAQAIKRLVKEWQPNRA